MQIVDAKRSQNVGIFLSTIKLSAHEIKDMLLKLDEKHLDFDTATRLLENSPSPEEVNGLLLSCSHGTVDSNQNIP